MAASDRIIYDRIKASTQILYSSNVNRERVMYRGILFNAMLREFHTLLDFDKVVTIRLCKIKGRGISGRYQAGYKLVELEYVSNIKEMMEWLAHELVHAEQYHTKKLEAVWVSGKGWEQRWNGKVCNNKGTTYNAYRNLPWEEEAFNRQKKLANTVYDRLVKQGYKLEE
jgi:hypothetical protein